VLILVTRPRRSSSSGPNRGADAPSTHPTQIEMDEAGDDD